MPNASASWAKILDYFFTPKTPSFAALATRKFDDGLGWNLDLLLGLGIEARSRLPFLLHQLTEAWQHEFAGLFYELALVKGALA